MTPALRCVPLVILTLAACQQPAGPRTRADLAARQACRDQVDRVYNVQNRADLSRRDERDYAFAGSYNSGIVTRGMSARYGRDQMVSDCIQSAGQPGAQATDTGEAPTFSPAQR
ncbi:MAG: hypothetical protein JOZ05_22870 [Acetobacteraceae bacterium]|nr:hypothetical protein [Acetobacteraceae bacterium]